MGKVVNRLPAPSFYCFLLESGNSVIHSTHLTFNFYGTEPLRLQVTKKQRKGFGYLCVLMTWWLISE
jgi:hypothetical protein